VLSALTVDVPVGKVGTAADLRSKRGNFTKHDGTSSWPLQLPTPFPYRDYCQDSNPR